MKETGTNLVEVTAHNGARPTHAQWQGGIYWLTNPVDGYKSLETETAYGDPLGLMGINCRHSFFPFLPQVMEPTYPKEPPRDPDPFEYQGKTYTHYDATQRQRAIENTIRKYKRRYTLDPTEENAQKINKWRNEYKEFSKAAGIREKWERTHTPNYGKSQSSKVAWADRKTNRETIEKQLDYIYNGKKEFIPTGTQVTNVKTIAGKGTDTELRKSKSLANEFGGEPEDWSKVVGKITSAKYIFDIHWYEHGTEKYKAKVKFRKEK